MSKLPGRPRDACDYPLRQVLRARDRPHLATQTLAKSPGMRREGWRQMLQRGRGSHVWDVDGNEFIDFNMASVAVARTSAPAIDRAIRAARTESHSR